MVERASCIRGTPTSEDSCIRRRWRLCLPAVMMGYRFALIALCGEIINDHTSPRDPPGFPLGQRWPATVEERHLMALRCKVLAFVAQCVKSVASTSTAR